MTLKVHHYFPLGSDNIGDHLVARAIRGALARHFGAIDFVNMPVNDRYRAGDRTIGLLGNNVERSNREADMTVIGGSNLLEPRRLRTVFTVFVLGLLAWGVVSLLIAGVREHAD